MDKQLILYYNITISLTEPPENIKNLLIIFQFYSDEALHLRA